MKPPQLILSASLAVLLGVTFTQAQTLRHVQVRTSSGMVEGVVSPDDKVRTFKGIPYAAPPVGPLRWKEPQPVAPWSGVRIAIDYPKRAMQMHVWDDMFFHDDGPSEDCLYLNLWMPEHHDAGLLPVMVWIHGGGFIAGASSEPRQDGGNLSKKGVLVVSMNYRLGVFGFFAHPELTKESGHGSSGNYGLLDQVAALRWVKENIAAFGGDPNNVTIFGESAGSMSVSSLMASPLAKGLFQKAIGESGAFYHLGDAMKTLAQAEKEGTEFAQLAFGTTSLEALRSLPADTILHSAVNIAQWRFSAIADGYFFPTDGRDVFAAGKQSHVPLLAGWNRDEGSAAGFFGADAPTAANFVAKVKKTIGNDADAFLKLYPASNDAEAKLSARDFAGDQLIAYSTWKWIETHLTTGGSPVYRYEFDQPLPIAKNARPGAEPATPPACDIEFVFRVLSSRDLPWRPEDQQVSEMMASYWTNFAKSGDPNGADLVHWPQYCSADGFQVMHLQAIPVASPDNHRSRYLFLDNVHMPPR